MQLSAQQRQAPGDIGRLQRSALGRRTGCEIASNRDERLLASSLSPKAENCRTPLTPERGQFAKEMRHLSVGERDQHSAPPKLPNG
jgi:hypothetical protein